MAHVIRCLRSVENQSFTTDVDENLVRAKRIFRVVYLHFFRFSSTSFRRFVAYPCVSSTRRRKQNAIPAMAATSKSAELPLLEATEGDISVEGSRFRREGLLGAVEQSLSTGSQRAVGIKFQVHPDLGDNRRRIVLAVVNCGEKEVGVGQGGV